MGSVISVIKKQDCVGCSSCVDSCPFEALHLELSPEGFYVASVDEKRCKECGLCQRVCPVLNAKNIEGENPIIGYVGWSKNDKVRISSSSGGVFYEIANQVLIDGGVVYAVVWDENFLPQHIRITEENKLWDVMGSKYVQSNINGIHRQIEKDLSSGRKVVFSGTPCQVAAARLFAENKGVEDLTTVEVICGGVCSIKIYQMYLQYVSRTKRYEIRNIHMRHKEHGWSKYSMNICYKDGSVYNCVITKDWFFKIYLRKYYHMNLCYNCPFAKFPRVADITIGDFWGIEKNLRDERGVSAVIANTQRGLELLKKIKNLVLIPVSVDRIVAGNPRLVNGHSAKPSIRQAVLHGNISDFRQIIRIVRKQELRELPKKVLAKIFRVAKRVVRIAISG